MSKAIFLLFIAGAILLLCGILILKQQYRSSETVSARILAAREIKQRRKGKSIHIPLPMYFYKLKYEWQGKEYVIDIKTESYLGEKGTDTLIDIDPAFPDQYGTSPVRGIAIAMIVVSVLLLLTGVILLVSTLSGSI